MSSISVSVYMLAIVRVVMEAEGLKVGEYDLVPSRVVSIASRSLSSELPRYERMIVKDTHICAFPFRPKTICKEKFRLCVPRRRALMYEAIPATACYTGSIHKR